MAHAIDAALRGAVRCHTLTRRILGRGLARLDDDQELMRLGYASLNDFAQQEPGRADRHWHELAAMEKKLRGYPALDAAYAEGSLSFSVVRLRSGTVPPEEEAVWARALEGCTVHEVEDALAKWKHARRSAALPGADGSAGVGHLAAADKAASSDAAPSADDAAAADGSTTGDDNPEARPLGRWIDLAAPPLLAARYDVGVELALRMAEHDVPVSECVEQWIAEFLTGEGASALAAELGSAPSSAAGDPPESRPRGRTLAGSAALGAGHRPGPAAEPGGAWTANHGTRNGLRLDRQDPCRRVEACRLDPGVEPEIRIKRTTRPTRAAGVAPAVAEISSPLFPTGRTLPMSKTRKPPDYWLLVIAFTLLILGLVMVFSASCVTAAGSADCHNDPYFFLKRQGMWSVVAVLAMFGAMRLDLEQFRKWSLPMVLLGVALLAAVKVPHIGLEANGATRWIGFHGFTFQPSEFAKFALAFYLADCLARRGSKIQQGARLIPLLMIFGVTVMLIQMEPDLGTAIVVAASFMGILFMSGARFSHLAGLAGMGITAMIFKILKTPYQIERITSFLNPWKTEGTSGFQVCQSLIALGSGGVYGLGLGESRQKFFYLPEQHTDFIFSILGEELGLVGTLAVLTLFALLLYKGLRLAVRTRDNYLALLAGGVTFTICFQAFLNMGVVSGALPLTGVPLPLISYGGTSLAITLAAIGLLVNVSSRRRERREESVELPSPPTETESLTRKFHEMGYDVAPTNRRRERRRTLR